MHDELVFHEHTSSCIALNIQARSYSAVACEWQKAISVKSKSCIHMPMVWRHTAMYQTWARSAVRIANAAPASMAIPSSPIGPKTQETPVGTQSKIYIDSAERKHRQLRGDPTIPHCEIYSMTNERTSFILNDFQLTTSSKGHHAINPHRKRFPTHHAPRKVFASIQRP